MPQMRMRDTAGTLRTITRVRMRDAAGVLRTIQRIRMRDAAGVLRTVYQYLSLAVDTNFAYGANGFGAPSGVVTSSTVTATPTGGTGPYTYLWAWVSGDIGITINSPTSAGTDFTATVGGASPKFATYTVTVTDANGATAVSEPVYVQLEWYP